MLYHETELCETTRFSYQCHLSGFFSEVIEWSKLGAPRKPFHKNGATALQMTTPTKIGGKARNPRNLYPEAVFFFFAAKQRYKQIQWWDVGKNHFKNGMRQVGTILHIGFTGSTCHPSSG